MGREYGDKRTKTPELGPCPQCGRVQLELARMRQRGLRPGFLPPVSDDAGWERLARDHAPEVSRSDLAAGVKPQPDCYWWETRGFRVLQSPTRSAPAAQGEGT